MNSARGARKKKSKTKTKNKKQKCKRRTWEAQNALPKRTLYQLRFFFSFIFI